MGITERREREKEALRTRIVEAARDIVSEEGLDALSMRAIAQRAEYSPATIYLYFRDKEALLREVIQAGFERMGEYMREEMEELGDGSAAEQYRALGRGYVRFAVENTAYFRVMFELPTVAHLDCMPEECVAGVESGVLRRDFAETMVQRAIDDGYFKMPDARRGTVVGWGLVHGLTSLYLSGHLSAEVSSHGEFLDLVEEAMAMLLTGWAPGETRVARAS
jgi:AcrR family transcriptional regulator